MESGSMGVRDYIMNPANVRLVNSAIHRALHYVRNGGGAVIRILVVDDDALIREMLVRVLRRAGYEMTSAANGKDALEAHEAQPVDLVITDICMPEMDGLETIAELRRQAPDLRIIAISDVAGPRSYLRAAESIGATRTLAKPFDAKLLLDTVKDISD
jgi:CheY-like chemotaxis protein